MKKTLPQRVGAFFLRFLVLPKEEEPEVINEIHDRAEEREGFRNESKDRRAEVLKLEESMNTLTGRVKNLEDRMSRLEDRSEDVTVSDRAPQSAVRKTDLSRPSAEPPARESRRSKWNENEEENLNEMDSFGKREIFQLVEEETGPVHRTAYSGRQPSNRMAVESFERVFCQALEQQGSGLEMDNLLRDLQAQLGDVQIETITVGSQEQVTGFFLLPSREGLAVVSPGGLADAEVAKFFNVEFGRRVFGCRQPARVQRDGSGFVVLRKGTVESS